MKTLLKQMAIGVVAPSLVSCDKKKRCIDSDQNSTTLQKMKNVLSKVTMVSIFLASIIALMPTSSLGQDYKYNRPTKIKKVTKTSDKTKSGHPDKGPKYRKFIIVVERKEGANTDHPMFKIPNRRYNASGTSIGRKRNPRIKGAKSIFLTKPPPSRKEIFINTRIKPGPSDGCIVVPRHFINKIYHTYYNTHTVKEFIIVAERFERFKIPNRKYNASGATIRGKRNPRMKGANEVFIHACANQEHSDGYIFVPRRFINTVGRNKYNMIVVVTPPSLRYLEKPFKKVF